jgi:hypothetical protein
MTRKSDEKPSCSGCRLSALRPAARYHSDSRIMNERSRRY